jgi:hypothetical protein
LITTHFLSPEPIFDQQLGVPFPSSALYRTGIALCTDPRYKIFAELNLDYDSAKIVPSPNYTLSVDEVYKQLVMSLIKESGRLDVLSLASLAAYPRHLDMPVPSWGTRLDFQSHQHCQFVRSGREKSLGR